MTIKLKLSPAGIEQAKKELAEYKAELNRRLELFIRKLAEKGVTVAQLKFAAAQYDGENDVTVSMEQNGKQARIIASGKSVAFIEFGAGTTFPEHPSGAFQHGTYGKGKGKNPNGWAYKGEQGTGGQYLRDGVYRTKGNPPAMAMWSATEEIAAAVSDTWREVMQS